MSLGVPELLIVLAIVLLLFGAKRLPQLARQVGGGVRELRAAIDRKDEEADAAERAPGEMESPPTPPAPPRG